MEIYYGIMFMVAAILQDSYEGFIPSIWLSGILFLNGYIVNILGIIGFGYFSSIILLELIIMLPLLMFISSKLGKVLVSVLSVSVVFNLLMMFSPLGFYMLVAPYYELVNIIFIECMLIYSLSQSRMKSGIKWLFNRGTGT